MKYANNRLLEIVYILLDKKNATAKELSEHFEVSKRTIYRDIDTLSAAGIPVYASKGKGGGIRLMDSFVLNKSLLSDKEQTNIIASLQGLKALNVPDVEPVLQKLAVMFNKNNTSWIDVDFSHWGSSSSEREKFNLLKAAILNRNVITFDYYSSFGEKNRRILEPVKLLFKGRGWYLYGYCRNKEDYRLFKITRMRNLACLNETYNRTMPTYSWENYQADNSKIVELVLKIDANMAYRVYDEFTPEHVEQNPNGSFTVTVCYPEDEWVYGYILSYGNFAEVIEPKHIREIIKNKMESGLKKYL